MYIVFTVNDKPAGHFVLIVEDVAAATPLLLLNPFFSIITFVWCGSQHLI